jgi:hypothetical protein
MLACRSFGFSALLVPQNRIERTLSLMLNLVNSIQCLEDPNSYRGVAGVGSVMGCFICTRRQQDRIAGEKKVRICSAKKGLAQKIF